jgi:glycosidase
MGAPFLRNHDMDRTGSVLSSDEARKLAAVGLFSMPGTPFMYYGEEIGMTGVRGSTDNDDNRRRTPMQWSSEPGAGFTTGTPWYPINADYVSINVEDQQGAGSLLSWYRTLIRLRHEDDALRRGGWAWVKATPSTVYAFLRGIGDGAVLVVMNFKNTAAEDVTVDLSPVGSWESGGDLLSATTFSGPLSGVVNLGTLPGYSARWIKMHQAAEAR